MMFSVLPLSLFVFKVGASVPPWRVSRCRTPSAPAADRRHARWRAGRTRLLSHTVAYAWLAMLLLQSLAYLAAVVMSFLAVIPPRESPLTLAQPAS
jgi:hypothetical protein